MVKIQTLAPVLAPLEDLDDEAPASLAGAFVAVVLRCLVPCPLVLLGDADGGAADGDAPAGEGVARELPRRHHLRQGALHPRSGRVSAEHPEGVVIVAGVGVHGDGRTLGLPQPFVARGRVALQFTGSVSRIVSHLLPWLITTPFRMACVTNNCPGSQLRFGEERTLTPAPDDVRGQASRLLKASAVLTQGRRSQEETHTREIMAAEISKSHESANGWPPPTLHCHCSNSRGKEGILIPLLITVYIEKY